MSRGLVIGGIAALIGMVAVRAAQLFQKMGKVGFPQPEGVHSLPATDSVAPLSYVSPIGAGTPVMSDYALSLPTLDMVPEIESISPLAQEYPVALDSFVPLEFSIPAPREYVSRESFVAALPHNKDPEVPVVNRVPVQVEPVKKTLGANDLRNLLAVLEGTGMKVKEVTALPSGAMRITFDEFMGSRKQPDLVRVRGQR